MRIFRSITQTILAVSLIAGASVACAETLVVSGNNNSIVIFDDAGAFVSSVPLPPGAQEPRDIAQAPNGEIFVLRGDSEVQRFDSGLNFIGSWMANGGQYGINVDDSGLVYVAGSGSTSVGVYNASGVLQTSLTPSGGRNLRDTVKVGVNIWVSNFTGPKIDVMDPGGSDIGDIASPLAPFGMQKAPNGDVWVVGQNDHEVRRITAAGTLAFTFDGDDGPNGPISSQLRYVGVGTDGNLYIPHRDSTMVDVYSDTGVYVATLTDSSLSGPDGILATGVFNNVVKTDQTITDFTATPAGGSVGDTSTLSATGGGSTMPVVFGTTNASLCTVVGNVVTYLVSGNCFVTANQMGDANYNPATEVQLVLLAAEANQTNVPVPTLSLWGLVTMFLIFLGVGGMIVRRKTPG
jgi:hypothetical protein